MRREQNSLFNGAYSLVLICNSGTIAGSHFIQILVSSSADEQYIHSFTFSEYHTKFVPVISTTKLKEKIQINQISNRILAVKEKLLTTVNINLTVRSFSGKYKEILIERLKKVRITRISTVKYRF